MQEVLSIRFMYLNFIPQSSVYERQRDSDLQNFSRLARNPDEQLLPMTPISISEC